MKSLLRDAMMQDPSFTTPPTSSTLSNKSDIAYKGLTAAGASLLASEIILGGDGREASLSTAGLGNVGVTLNPRGGAADGSAESKSSTHNKAGEIRNSCLRRLILNKSFSFQIFILVSTCFFSADPVWKSMTISEVLESIQLEHLLELFEKEQVFYIVDIYYILYTLISSLM